MICIFIYQPSYRPNFINKSPYIKNYFCGRFYLGTFKVTKVRLQSEGYEVTKIKDPLYFLDPSTQQFSKLDEKLMEKINSGQMRL